MTVLRKFRDRAGKARLMPALIRSDAHQVRLLTLLELQQRDSAQRTGETPFAVAGSEQGGSRPRRRFVRREKTTDFVRPAAYTKSLMNS